jgi:flagellar hook-associated protein 3 FlgL
MVTRVTTPGNYSAVLANLLAAQQRQQDAGNKVATQKNGVNLKEYAGSAEILTSMQSLSTRLGVLREQNDVLSAKLETQDTGIKRVADAAGNVKQIIAEALASDRVDTLFEDIESQLRDAVDAMNGRWNGKYLFAGGQVDTQPVTVTALADLTAGPPIASFFQNDSFKVAAKVDEATTIATGVLASDLGTNMMNQFKAFETFQQGAGGPFTGQMTAAQRTFLEGELASWETIRSDVTDMAARNGMVQKRVETIGHDLVTRSDTLAGMIGKVTDADMAQAAANLQQAQLSVQSAAYVFQALQQSSLINILK